jgi:hypothetical protein
MSPLGQADGEVQLQDDWIQPSRETEPEDGGKVQAPAEGDTLQNLFGQLSYQGQTTMDFLPNTSQYFHFILPTSLRRLKWRKVPGRNAYEDVKNHGPDQSTGFLHFCI